MPIAGKLERWEEEGEERRRRSRGLFATDMWLDYQDTQVWDHTGLER